MFEGEHCFVYFASVFAQNTLQMGEWFFLNIVSPTFLSYALCLGPLSKRPDYAAFLQACTSQAQQGG